MKKLGELLGGLIVFYLAYVFLVWYIKGHFGKYFIFFWLNTILSIGMYYDHKQNPTWPQHPSFYENK